MIYCNKNIMDLMIKFEEQKIEAHEEHSFNNYLKADSNLSYFVLGLQMAGMSEIKTLKLKRVAMKILEKKIEEADINDKD